MKIIVLVNKKKMKERYGGDLPQVKANEKPRPRVYRDRFVSADSISKKKIS